MKKALAAILFLLAVLPWLSASADGSEIAERSGLTGIENGALTSEELDGSARINLFQKAFDITVGAFKDNGKGIAARFGLLLASVIFAGVMNAMKFGSEGIEKAAGYISLLVVSAAAFSVVYDLAVFVTAAMHALYLALAAMTPVTAALYVMGGNPGAAAASGTGTALFLTVLQAVCNYAVLPLVKVCFALSLASAIPGGVDLSRVASAVKTAAVTLLSFVFALVGFTVHLQTSVSATADTYLTRSVRFASGAAIPVIGNVIGEAFRTAAGAVGAVKGVAGAAGVTAVLAATLPAFIAVFLWRFLLGLCSAAAKALCCDNVSAMLGTLCGITGILTALTAGAATVSLIAFAAFVNSVR